MPVQHRQVLFERGPNVPQPALTADDKLYKISHFLTWLAFSDYLRREAIAVHRVRLRQWLPGPRGLFQYANHITAGLFKDTGEGCI